MKDDDLYPAFYVGALASLWAFACGVLVSNVVIFVR